MFLRVTLTSNSLSLEKLEGCYDCQVNFGRRLQSFSSQISVRIQIFIIIAFTLFTVRAIMCVCVCVFLLGHHF